MPEKHVVILSMNNPFFQGNKRG